MKLFDKTSVQIFESIKELACQKLTALDPKLTYHDIHHTLDVLKQSERIAKEEGVTDERELYLLRIAALYHDTGFLRTYAKHEPVSCTIFLEDTKAFGFTSEDKTFVTSLIMATRLPQIPKTLHERIICDADLDYLGRHDFLKIGDGLRREFLNFGIIDTDEEWAVLQLKFLTGHHYHTASSQKTREAVKQQNIADLL
jgi:uncharacterized protein